MNTKQSPAFEILLSECDSEVQQYIKLIENENVNLRQTRIYYDEYVTCPYCKEKVRAGEMKPTPEPLDEFNGTGLIGWLMVCTFVTAIIAVWLMQ